jgi:DNA-binding CsgD family transcriptional regulator
MTGGLDRSPASARLLVVLEGPPGCAAAEAARVSPPGARIVEGFRIGFGNVGTTICIGVVVDRVTAADALLAAIGGAGLIVEARADSATTDRLVDDLRRLGRVEHRVVRADEPSAGDRAVLGPEARAILGLLAEGHSLGEAAVLLGLARRTADRRLADARRALGVERTTEAITRARRLGWLHRLDRPEPGTDPPRFSGRSRPP